MRVISLFAVLTIVACRSNSSNSQTDATGSGSGSGSAVTIQDVQSDSMAPGTPVTLSGVVVTAVDSFGAKTGDLWVEEMGGGKRSGVHVYKASASGIVTGDVVNVSNCIKSEFALTGSNADPSGRTVIELEPPTKTDTVTVTKVSSGATITPDKVDAFAIGQMYDSTMSATGGGSAFSAAWEDWEGVLIELDNVAAASAAKPFGSTTPTPADNYSFNITGVAKVEGSLTDITMSNIARATCFANMTGVVDYFYDFLVLPRSSSDFATGGTGCPAPEQAVNGVGTTCTDGIDNDANGFIDCQDLGCETGSNAWLGSSCTTDVVMCGCSVNLTSSTSVHTVDTVYATTSSPVYMRDVYITAINGTTSYWVADSTTATASGGVYVYGTPPSGAVIGQKLATLQGVAGPYKPHTLSVIEISDPTAGALSGAASPITPIANVATDVLADATMGAVYSGSLVTLAKAKVTTAANATGEVVLTDGAGKKITMDDGAFQYYGGTNATPTPPALGACLTITGIMDVQTTDNIRTINPRSAADIATSAGCP